MPNCLWKGTYLEKDCTASICPKHGIPNNTRRALASLDRFMEGNYCAMLRAQLKTYKVTRRHSQTDDGYLAYIDRIDGKSFSDNEKCNLEGGYITSLVALVDALHFEDFENPLLPQ